MHRLAETAEQLGLRNSAAWCSDYGLGFAYAHVFEGQVQARAGFWFGWFWQPGALNDAIQQRLVPELLVRHMGVPHSMAQARFRSACRTAAQADSAKGDQRIATGQLSAFENGVADANRLLQRLTTQSIDNDAVSQRIHEFEQDFKATIGRSAMVQIMGARFSDQFYPYMVARTLGAGAFGVTFSAEDLWKLISRSADPRS